MSARSPSPFDDITNGVDLAGFSRNAADEGQASGQRDAGRVQRIERVQHGGEGALLLAGAAPAHDLASNAEARTIGDVALVRSGHAARRIIHCVPDQHQRTAAGVGAEMRDQAAHGIETAHSAESAPSRGAMTSSMKRLSWGSASSNAVCGLGTRTRSISNCLQVSRESCDSRRRFSVSVVMTMHRGNVDETFALSVSLCKHRASHRRVRAYEGCRFRSAWRRRGT